MNKNKANRLGEEAIYPLLLKLSIPSIIAMTIQALYNVVDSIYIGHLSKEALSALSLAFPIQMILISIAVGTGVGTSSFISRQLGTGNKERAINGAEHIILISLIYGLIVGIMGFFLSEHLLRIFTNNQALIKMGTEYIRIILIGSFAMFVPIISNNILRGEGNTFIPMVSMLIGSVLNIILDPFFIFGIGIFPKWGVAGAAFATVLARFLSGAFITYILFFSSKNELTISLKSFKYDFTILKEIFTVGLPAMVMQFLASIMIAGMNLILATYSATAIAAGGIYFRLQSFVFMPVFGLNQGFLPIMGYNYGHNNPERMKKTFKAALLISIIFNTIGFLIFQSIPELLIKMFNGDPELVRVGSNALKIISLAFPVIGPAIVISTTFQSMGKGIPSLLLSFMRQIIVLLPVMYLLGNLFGLNYLWFAFPISEVLNTGLAIIWLRSTLKQVFTRMASNSSN